MLKQIVNFFFILSFFIACKPSTKIAYRLNVVDEITPGTRSKIDSTITILSNRLHKAGYKADISFDDHQQQFVLKVDEEMSADFIKTVLLNNDVVNICEAMPLEVFMTIYNATPKRAEELGHFISPEQYPMGSLGFIRINDTAAFAAYIRLISNELPANSFIAYQELTEKQMKNRVKIYICYDNENTVHVNRYIEKASQDFGYNGHPSIKFKLNAIGANRFAKLTRNNTGRPIPIIVNGKVISAPNVASEVEDGNVEISGAFTIAEAQDIANAISSGTLPLKLQLVRSN